MAAVGLVLLDVATQLTTLSAITVAVAGIVTFLLWGVLRAHVRDEMLVATQAKAIEDLQRKVEQLIAENQKREIFAQTLAQQFAGDRDRLVDRIDALNGRLHELGEKVSADHDKLIHLKQDVASGPLDARRIPGMGVNSAEPDAPQSPR